MKKFIFIIFFITSFIVFDSYGQVIATKVVQSDNKPYDCTENFLGKNVYKYVGQKLYVKGEPEDVSIYGYEGFLLDYTKTKFKQGRTNVYKCCDGDNSKYDELVGKYFDVIEIIKYPKDATNEKFYLKLREKESNDIVYYGYDAEYDLNFPFIIVCFLEKQKKLIGKEFIISDTEMEHIVNGAKDIFTEQPIVPKHGDIWKCVNVTIENKNYDLVCILQNSAKGKVAYKIENFLQKLNHCIFTTNDANMYSKKFDVDNWNTILEGRVILGWTKEMCKLSLGEPKSIKQTTIGDKKVEQWTYIDGYIIYFDNNGILMLK